MYHRIDGKLVAVGVIDILDTIFHSAYYIYDPEYSFLSLGVIGAIREIEYMRLIKEKYNPNMKWYHLSEMSPTCSKVNYKLNYRPGFVVCPRTKNLVSYDSVKEYALMISQLPIEDKSTLPYIQLD
jgi:arginine-tRNA-protein transferase